MYGNTSKTRCLRFNNFRLPCHDKIFTIIYLSYYIRESVQTYKTNSVYDIEVSEKMDIRGTSASVLTYKYLGAVKH